MLTAWVIGHDLDLGWLGFGGISYDLARLKERTGRPLVIETESVWSRFLLRELPFEPDPRRRAEILAAGRAKEAEERWGASYADITTAVSDEDAAYFHNLTPDHDRVVIVPNVIEVDAYQGEPAGPPVTLEPRSLCFSGTMGRGTANIDATNWLLDEVMPLVWRQAPDTHLYLVGKDPAPEILARRSERVHVTGPVESIVPYLRQSAASLVPLRWESGTRFKILEAFACRCPVVSTTLGAEGIQVTHAQHLLLADTPEDFANAALKLLSDAAERERLSAAGYELVRREYDVSSAARCIGVVMDKLGFGAQAAPPALAADAASG
jgi:glycosyltransferase involved in cell wall biosynthesis